MDKYVPFIAIVTAVLVIVASIYELRRNIWKRRDSCEGRQLDFNKIAKGLGGKHKGKIPKPGGGYFGALQTARDVRDLRKKNEGDD